MSSVDDDASGLPVARSMWRSPLVGWPPPPSWSDRTPRPEAPVGHVTVVADDADQSDQLETALSTQGHQVTGLDRPGVPECSRLAGTTDLVVVIGPPQYGCAVSAALRRGGVDACILVVGSGAKNDRIAGLQAGADDYLTTPYHLDELFARVRALLRHRRYRAVR